MLRSCYDDISRAHLGVNKTMSKFQINSFRIGLTEKFNDTLCKMLASYCDETQSDWDTYIPLVHDLSDCLNLQTG